MTGRAAPASVGPEVPPRLRHRTPQAIIDYLDTFYERWHTAFEVMDYLERIGRQVKLTSVRRALERLADEGVIDKTPGTVYERACYRGHFLHGSEAVATPDRGYHTLSESF